MKYVYLLLAMIGFGFEGQAAGFTKAQVLKDYSQFSYSLDVYKVKGSSIDEMLRDLAVQKGTSEEFFTIVNDPASIPDPDEETGQYGTCTRALNLSLVLSEAKTENGDELNKSQVDRIKAASRALESLGLVFGYTGEGGSACGVTWPSPLIIDVKAKKIYEIVLVGGSC